MDAALYRESTSEQWREVEIIGRTLRAEYVIREVGRIWPGVAFATADQLRIPGRTFNLRHGGREL